MSIPFVNSIGSFPWIEHGSNFMGYVMFSSDEALSVLRVNVMICLFITYYSRKSHVDTKRIAYRAWDPWPTGQSDIAMNNGYLWVSSHGDSRDETHLGGHILAYQFRYEVHVLCILNTSGSTSRLGAGVRRSDAVAFSNGRFPPSIACWAPGRLVQVACIYSL